MAHALPPRPQVTFCNNCRSFHPGRCRYARTQCWQCGGWGHVRRNCRNLVNSINENDENHPGSRAWCRKMGLEGDPSLQGQIMRTLRQYPGATIYINDECICEGVQAHFWRPALMRNQAERASRRDEIRGRQRSRSPVRDLVRRRSRSPLLRYSESPERAAPRGFEPSPSTVMFEESPQPWRSADSHDFIHPQRQSLVNTKENNSMSAVTPFQPRTALVRSSLTSPVSHMRIQEVSPAAGRSLAPVLHSALQVRPQNQQPRLPTVREVEMQDSDDPYVILGLPRTATKAQIIHAYEQGVFEIELERTGAGNTVDKSGLQTNEWDQQTRVLYEAKRRLVGY